MTKEEAWKLANDWIAAWNAHELDRIMTHYLETIVLTSPVAVRLLGLPDGTVTGKANVRAYFQHGLEAYPERHFELQDVFGAYTVSCSATQIRSETARRSSWNCRPTQKWREW